MEYLADTVALVRHFSKNGQIGKRAKQILKDADLGDHIIYISIISMVEVMYLTDANRIPLNFGDIKKKILNSDNYRIIDLTMEIVEIARTIEGLELHDRLIVATGKYLNIPILTTDHSIENSGIIEVIWK